MILKLAVAAEAEPHDKVSPAPASLVLSSSFFGSLVNREIFTFLKNFLFLTLKKDHLDHKKSLFLFL